MAQGGVDDVDMCAGSADGDSQRLAWPKVQLQDCRHGEWTDQRGKSLRNKEFA